jgi:hypothetical protein
MTFLLGRGDCRRGERQIANESSPLAAVANRSLYFLSNYGILTSCRIPRSPGYQQAYWLLFGEEMEDTVMITLIVLAAVLGPIMSF